MSHDLAQQVTTKRKIFFYFILSCGASSKNCHFFLLKGLILFLHDNLASFYSPQVHLPPNGQPQAYGLAPGQGFPAMVPPVGHTQPGQPIPGPTGPSGFPGLYPPHGAAQQQQVNLRLKHNSCPLNREKKRLWIILWETAVVQQGFVTDRSQISRAVRTLALMNYCLMSCVFHNIRICWWI